MTAKKPPPDVMAVSPLHITAGDRDNLRALHKAQHRQVLKTADGYAFIFKPGDNAVKGMSETVWSVLLRQALYLGHTGILFKDDMKPRHWLAVHKEKT